MAGGTEPAGRVRGWTWTLSCSIRLDAASASDAASLSGAANDRQARSQTARCVREPDGSWRAPSSRDAPRLRPSSRQLFERRPHRPLPTRRCATAPDTFSVAWCPHLHRWHRSWRCHAQYGRYSANLLPLPRSLRLMRPASTAAAIRLVTVLRCFSLSLNRSRSVVFVRVRLDTYWSTACW